LKYTALSLLAQKELGLFQKEQVIYIDVGMLMQHTYKKSDFVISMDFREFLLKKQHVPEKNVPFYLRWVAQV